MLTIKSDSPRKSPQTSCHIMFHSTMVFLFSYKTFNMSYLKEIENQKNDK